MLTSTEVAGRLGKAVQGAMLAWALSACTEQLDLGVHASQDGQAVVAADGGGDEGAGGNGPAGGRGGRGGSGGTTCAVPNMRELQLEAGKPIAFVALQRSASMLKKLGDRSKLELAGFAIERAFTGRRLSVGFIQFPGFFPLCDPEFACCATPLLVTPKPDAGKTIRRIVTCEGQSSLCFQTGNSVPTAAALQQIRSFISGLNVPGPRAVLLLTDGDPSCGGANACDAAVAQTAGLFQEDTETYVLPFGEEAAASACLVQIARAGDTLSPDGRLAPISNDGQLDASLQEALKRIESGFCEYRFRFAPRRRSDVHVFIDGMEIPQTDSRSAGSSFAFAKDSASRINIAGPECEALKRQNTDVRAYELCCSNDRDCHQ